MARVPDLADMVRRADAVLADDDHAFARQATDDHAEAWEARWLKLERRADAAGLSVHDHGAAAGAIEGARRLLRDPALGQAHQDRISDDCRCLRGAQRSPPAGRDVARGVG